MQLTPEFINSFYNSIFGYDDTFASAYKEYTLIKKSSYNNTFAATIYSIYEGGQNPYWNLDNTQYARFLKFKHKWDGGEKFDKDIKDLLE